MRPVATAAALAFLGLLDGTRSALPSPIAARAISADEFRSDFVTAAAFSQSLPSLTMKIELAGGPLRGATRYRRLMFVAADDLGERLSRLAGVSADGSNYEPLVRPTDGGPPRRDRMVLDLGMQVPSRAATKLTKIEGTLTLLTGRMTSLSFGKLAALVGRRLMHPLLTECGIEVSVTRFDPSQNGGLEVRISGRLDRLERIYLVDASGKPLREDELTAERDWQAGVATTYEERPAGPIPRGAALRIVVLANAKEVEVPFGIKDIPLP